MKAPVQIFLKFFQLFSLIVISLSVPISAYAAVCSSSGSSTSYEWIDSLQVENFSNVSGNNLGYADFTTTQTIPLLQGLQNISLMPGFAYSAYTEYWSVWIDFNQNQIFEDTEQVFTSTSSLAVDGSINVPTTALPGLTTMRVSMKAGSAPTACEIFTSGEVEDYTVEIAGEPVPGAVPTLYTLNVDNNLILSRTGALGDSAVWVIEKDGAIVLQRNADNELTYLYYNNTLGSKFKVWLTEAGKQASNIVEYEPGLPVSSHEISVDSNYMVSRTGYHSEPLTWVIEKDGLVVLERNAENELDYTYFNNMDGSYYRVWLKQFIDGSYEIVSNVIHYVPGGVVVIPTEPVEPIQFTLNVDNNYILSRTGELGDNVTWEIEKDGVIVLSRNAATEMTYQYYINTLGSSFRVWLAVGGQRASNVVEYEPGLPVSSHEISVDSNYMVSRTGDLGEPLTWVIEKDGLVVLERNAENELDYTYFNNVDGSYYRVWLKQFIDGAYEIVSNVKYYVPGIAINEYTTTLTNSYDLIRDGNLGESVRWVIEENGMVIFEQDASVSLSYNFPDLMASTNYRAWLVNSENTIVSNILEFTTNASFGTYSLSTDPTNRIYRSGKLGDSVTWVIEKNGTIVLQRSAADELDYLYTDNTSGSEFRVWLQQFDGSSYYRVSDIVEYNIP